MLVPASACFSSGSLVAYSLAVTGLESAAVMCPDAAAVGKCFFFFIGIWKEP